MSANLYVKACQILLTRIALLSVVAAFIGTASASAQENPAGISFVDEFSSFSTNRWYVSDGWTNGDHQNCTWSKRQLRLADGILTLSFEKRPFKDRAYVCAEVQTKQRFSYGVYEARMKTDTGSGLNAAFFTYIGPADKQPHDEIDFEVLTRDTSKVDVNTYVEGQPKNGGKLDLDVKTDSQFNDYAFVWEPQRMRWFVNGRLMHETASGAELPTHPQKIFFSLWGTDTLTDWMGPFSDPGRKVVFDVDRVAFTALGEPCQFPESIACNLK